MACRRIVYYVGKAALGVHFNADLSEDSNELQSKKIGRLGREAAVEQILEES